MLIKALLPRKFVACSSLLLLSCQPIVIKNYRECVASGSVLAGADCAETNTGRITQMDFEAFVEWLEPQNTRPDPDRPGEMLPARAGAVCRSDEDFTAQKIAIEQACAILKKRCTPEMRDAIRQNAQNIKRLQIRARKKKNPL